MRIFALAVLAAVSLSGCTVYHVAATAVDVTATAVGTTADVAGAVISAPFRSGDDKKKSD
jgi:hypothetical protein